MRTRHSQRTLPEIKWTTGQSDCETIENTHPPLFSTFVLLLSISRDDKFSQRKLARAFFIVARVTYVSRFNVYTIWLVG